MSTPKPKIKSLSVAEMIELDRVMMEDYGISLEMMMENAGKTMALLVRRLQPKVCKVMVLAGSGHNGGGGIVAARHLHNWGYDVSIVLTAKLGHLKPMVKKQLGIVKKIGLKVLPSASLSDAKLKQSIQASKLIIDAMLGYSSKGEPRGEIKRAIEAIDNFKASIIALDIPTGLDPTTGQPSSLVVRAKATLALALPNHGLVKKVAQPFVGQLYLGDISVPRQWYYKQGIKTPLFNNDIIVKYLI